MSTELTTDLPILLSELESLALFGVRIEDRDETGCILAVGSDYLHACAASEYAPVFFTRYAGNDAIELLQLIAEHYEVAIIDEYDRRYAQCVEQDERREKEAVCPLCSTMDIARILYGPREMTPGLQRVIGSGQIVLDQGAGLPASPAWKCNGCEHTWGRIQS